MKKSIVVSVIHRSPIQHALLVSIDLYKRYYKEDPVLMFGPENFWAPIIAGMQDAYNELTFGRSA